jgi:acetyltransferase-like isoleucine patch superfamily enzyme
MFGRDRLAIPFVSDENIVVHADFQRIVCGITIITLEEHVRGVRLWFYQFSEREERDAFPSHVELTPSGDAMKVADIFKLRESEKLLPVERHRVFDFAVDSKLPFVQRNIGPDAEVEHGKIMNLPLTWGKTLRGSNSRLGVTGHFSRPAFFALDQIGVHENKLEQQVKTVNALLTGRGSTKLVENGRVKILAFSNGAPVVYSAGMFKPADLFDLNQSEHAAIFEGCEFAWEALKKISAYVEAHLPTNPSNQSAPLSFIGERVLIGEGTTIEPGAMIKGPAIIGKNCEIRHNAYIRENVIIGDRCVVGNSTEVKNSLLFNQSVAPHFNYVGDSILGFKAHIGAGVVLSNIKSLAGNVTVEREGHLIDTGLRKFGALLGDLSEVGCNSVLNPGSIIGRSAVIYPGTNWRGVLAANMIAKNRSAIEVVERQQQRT